MEKILYQSVFILRTRYLYKITSFFRKSILKCLGMRIGKETVLRNICVTWPHQISIGANCTLEQGIYFKYDGIYQKGFSIIIGNNVFIGSYCEFNCNLRIKVGEYSNIASGCKFIDHDHGTEAGELIGGQAPVIKSIEIGRDVWLGFNVVVLKGVTINDGAVVAAGSVVTKYVPENEIWGGVPARKIGVRKNSFDKTLGGEQLISNI